MSRCVRIGTRGSALALWQAEWVRAHLRQSWPDVEVELVPIKTTGDMVQAGSLARLGGKGLFVKEIEEALLAGAVDLAVHSIKDLPAEFPAGLMLAAVPERGDVRDVLVSRDGQSLLDLPAGTRVGTSSLRRQALLLHLHPALTIETLRGNVDTRLRKQQEGVVDATVLAAAGLARLGLAPPNCQKLDPNVFLPAVGQGALGIETRIGDPVLELLHPLHDADSTIAIQAERGFLRRLGGSCRTPLAARAMVVGEMVQLDGLVASPDGRSLVRGRHIGPVEGAERVGAELAVSLLARGARRILDQLET